jgi:hypothetical protein
MVGRAANQVKCNGGVQFSRRSSSTRRAMRAPQGHAIQTSAVDACVQVAALVVVDKEGVQLG